jgi:hypothetical protein
VHLDAYGILIGIASYIIAGLVGMYLLSRFNLATSHIMFILILSLIGHFFAATVYNVYSFTHHADANEYFAQANNNFGISTQFVLFFTYWVRHLITADSRLGTFFVYSAL